MKLRHVGLLVRDLERAVQMYKELGFTTAGRVEILRAQKMKDEDGKIFELIEGDYHDHIALNWVEDKDGNWIELVEVKR